MLVPLASLAALLAVVLAGHAVAQETREIEHQGVKRSAIVVKAGGGSEGARPLWLVLHGRRPVAEANRSSPALDALARRQGFIAVYPAALGGKWNYVGETTPPSMAASAPADDVGFLTALIDGFIAEQAADPRRIYVSGFSQGGFMTYSLACALAERIAAAAPMGASMTEAQIALCRPVRAVPMAVIAGTVDRIVPYDGWLTGTYRLTSIPETMEHWRRLHGCTGQRLEPIEARSEAARTRTSLIEWTGCARDGALRLYRVEGGGHTLPSLTPPPAGEEKRLGPRSADFETSDEVWSFLRRWSL